MRHPSKVGSFLARYVKRGMEYDMAKNETQGKNILNQEKRDAEKADRTRALTRQEAQVKTYASIYGGRHGEDIVVGREER